jgi:hypothetical protein
MSKLQDLFKPAGGPELLDVKLKMKIESFPVEGVDKPTKTGGTVTVWPVKLSREGVTYDWELNAAQVARIFSKTSKAGDVTWQAAEGDIVNVWYATNQKAGGYNYFAAEAADEADEDMVEVAQKTFQQKPQFAKKGAAPRGSAPTGETKWDGSPTLGNLRAGIAGIYQSILSNPNVNPFAPEQRTEALAISIEEMLKIRMAAKAQEESLED